MELTQENLLKYKAKLDAVIDAIDALEAAGTDAYRSACKLELLDMREAITRTTAHVAIAKGNILLARAFGGEIEGGNVTRGGGT